MSGFNEVGKRCKLKVNVGKNKEVRCTMNIDGIKFKVMFYL